MTYDLLIIGGGINGCAIAREAALLGQSVLLVERDDLAAHTSSASTKLIHGGLRYLELYDFRLVAEALRERERLVKAAPHLIRPMRFVLPHENAIRPWWIVRLGLVLYDLLGGRMTLKRSRGLRKGDTAYTAPLKGDPRGFVYSDAFVDDARLTLANARDAADNGPQIAVGVERKSLDAGGLAPTLAALGAKDRGTDVYLSATKLFLAQSLLVNLTLRSSKANQNGLLGFGGSAHTGRSLLPEASLACLLRRDLALGAELRVKPDKLNPSLLGDGLREDDWKDLFVAWAPSKTLSLTAAWVDLGRIVPAVATRRQRGPYLSAQLSF